MSHNNREFFQKPTNLKMSNNLKKILIMIKKKRTMNNNKIMKKVKNLRTTIKPKQTTTKTKVVLQENHESVKDIITQGKANRGSINRSTIEEKINKKMNKL